MILRDWISSPWIRAFALTKSASPVAPWPVSRTGPRARRATDCLQQPLAAGAAGSRAERKQRSRAAACRWRPFAIPSRYTPRSMATAHRRRILCSGAPFEIGAQLGTRSIYLFGPAGAVRLDWEQAAERFAEAVAPCRAAAKSAGSLPDDRERVGALCRPAHRSFTGRHNPARRVGRIGVYRIVYCWAEAGLTDWCKRALPRCSLVQVSDYVLGDRSLPNRAVPGNGMIPLERIIGMLLEGGYKGAFDIELVGPRIDAEVMLPPRIAQRSGYPRSSSNWEHKPSFPISAPSPPRVGIGIPVGCSPFGESAGSFLKVRMGPMSLQQFPAVDRRRRIG